MREFSLLQIFKNSSWHFFENIIRFLITIFLTAKVANQIGPVIFGEISYLLSIIGIIATISCIPSSNVLIHEIVNKKIEQFNKITLNSIVLMLASSILLFISCYLILYLSESHNQSLWTFIILSTVVLIKPFELINTIFLSQFRSHIIAKSNIISYLIAGILKFSLILSGSTLPFLAFFFILDLLISKILNIIVFIKSGMFRANFESLDLKYQKELFKNSIPIIFAGLFSATYMKIDQIMILHMLGSKENGIYSFAIIISEKIFIIPLILSQVISPILLKKESVTKNESEKYKFLYSIIIKIAIIISLIITLVSDVVFETFMNREYIESSQVLKTHIWCLIFISIGLISSKFLYQNGFLKIYLLNTFLSAACNIIMNFFFINFWGIVGAAYASIASQALATFLCFYFYAKTRNHFKIICKGFIC